MRREILILPRLICRKASGFLILVKPMAGVSTATGFAANVGSNVLSGLWNNVVQVVKMIISLPTAIRHMNDQLQRLKDVRDDINAVLAREQRPAKIIVQNWLNKAGRAIESSQSISNEYEQHRNCLGFCPNCLYRYRIDQDIRTWKMTVDQLHSEKQSDFPPSGEYWDSTPCTHIPIRHPEFAGNGIQAAQLELERLLIEDTNIRVIGVYGMGGIGKTSLLQTINNSQKVIQSFDHIFWATVSQNYDILDLQNCIASRLNLTLPDRSDSEGRKHKLYTYLKDKKFLLILDDMWKILKLESLGVSLKDTASKIVLSTRSRIMCTQMNVDVSIRVEPLSEEEGWQLFCKGAFRSGNVPQEIEDVARKIAGECKGLPLAINVVAAAMKDDAYRYQWEVALDQMQTVNNTFYDLHNEIEEDLFQPLKWSYDVLSDDLKTCFIYFAAYPEDSLIDCQPVIDIWIAEGLVKSSGESYLPDTAHSFINFLKDRCLIEVVHNDKVGRISTVKIHDVLRDMAIRIATKEHRCYFKAGQGVSRFPVHEEVGGCARMSLTRNDLHSLPTTFPCSSLSVLLLRENPGIKEVPGSFLRELPSLKVLDLSKTGITSLPPSIGDLKHLASLQLEGTDICELPETIGDLKELQFLNVNSCQKLRCLPERIGDLKRLRALQVMECVELRKLPRGMSELVALERLEMWKSHISLHFEKDGNEERKYACLKDLQSLRRLRHLSVTIKSPLKEGVIGNWSKMRHLILLFYVNQDYLPQDMQAMKDLEWFVLCGCDVERLPSWVSEFRMLSYLRLYWCKQLRELELGMGFPKLETLALDRLESLECVGAVAARASGSGGLGEGASQLPPMLKSLSVYDCEKLKRLRGGWDKLKCMEEIKGSREWWDAIEWEDTKSKFRNNW